MRAPNANLNAETVLLHVDMLNDRTRTSSYLESIRRNVQAGDVVLDIGTGTGIYAMAAAQAGARHVYAIEAGPIARAARALFEVNGLSDRITLLRGWSTELWLPERADVLISEVIGNEPLAEGVVGVTKDALKRLVKPDARLVPSRIKIYGLPVSVPNKEIGKLTFTQETLNNWKSWYGLNFDLLAKATKNSMFDSVFGYFVNPKTMEGWKPLSDAVLFADIDFRTWRGRRINNTQTVKFTASGQLNAMITFFELYDDNETDAEVDEDSAVDEAQDNGEANDADGDDVLPFYTSDPDEVDRNNHWLSPVRIFVEPLRAQAGNSFEVNYWYRPETRVAGCKVRLHQ
ncbi:MAG TPA: 50S ribosomal protein L11 methyltransferase [Pyrinomonadaceae bacterium]|jgi:2-polyprenyl-3-methyl-5-hydroxy-6-metoxy-1,4-benzoquinol methylase|nr:50S ribosomal protein L11 methyltransferase [Pyrinomonadaceae bacterium]